MSYPGTRVDIFNGEGKGPTVRRDILLEATQALFGVIRLATASEIASGNLDAGSKGPAVIDLSLANQHILTPIKNLLTSLNNEISARTNGDNSLWASVNGIQNQINSGMGECLVWNISGNTYIDPNVPAAYLPTGGTYFVFYRASYQVSLTPGFLFVPDIKMDDPDNSGFATGASSTEGWKAAIMAGGSQVPVGPRWNISSQYSKYMGTWAFAFKLGKFTQYNGRQV